MKLKGKKVEGTNVEVVVIPRSDENIVFFCEAVKNYEDFDELCPKPEPPERLYPGGVRKKNIEDPEFKKAIDEWNNQRTAWTIITSLAATADLEWETVRLDTPSTWGNYEKELKESFTDIEMYRIIQGVLRANCLDEEMLKEAKKNFLQEQSLQKEK